MNKRVILEGAEYKLPDSTIKHEIISFSELNFESYLETLDKIDAAADDVVTNEECKTEIVVQDFIKFTNIITEACKRLQK